MTEQHIKAALGRYNPQLEAHSITPLLSGLSNDNYLVRCQQTAFLFKHYRQHWPEIGLATQQYFAKQGFCPAPVWLEANNRIAIFNYIEGNIAQNYHDDLLKQLVAVHQYPVKTTPMDISSELTYYKDCALYQRYSEVVAQALRMIAKCPIALGFCHNDLVRENIIINEYQTYLIDFEYAQTNDVYFDLASLVVSFNMTQGETQQLLDGYQQQLKQPSQFYNSLVKLQCYQVVFLVLCICWYEQRAVTDKVVLLRAQLDKLKAKIII